VPALLQFVSSDDRSQAVSQLFTIDGRIFGRAVSAS